MELETVADKDLSPSIVSDQTMMPKPKGLNVKVPMRVGIKNNSQPE
jgi:hypothetical protein